jgi:nicotinamidase-related amidase
MMNILNGNTLNEKQEVLIGVDTQYDLMMPDGKYPIKNATELLFMMNIILKHWRFDRIIATLNSINPAKLGDKPEKLLCTKGTIGCQSVIDYPNGTVFIEKESHNVWNHNTEQMLDALPKDKNNTIVYVFGLPADLTVGDTIKGLLKHGYEVRVLSEQTKGIHRQMKQVLHENFDLKTEKVMSLILTPHVWQDVQIQCLKQRGRFISA